jgi:hypothetical protein
MSSGAMKAEIRICRQFKSCRTFFYIIFISIKVSATMMHKVKCTDCTTLRKCNLIHQTGLKVDPLTMNLHARLLKHLTKIYFWVNPLSRNTTQPDKDTLKLALLVENSAGLIGEL